MRLTFFIYVCLIYVYTLNKHKNQPSHKWSIEIIHVPNDATLNATYYINLCNIELKRRHDNILNFFTLSFFYLESL